MKAAGYPQPAAFLPLENGLCKNMWITMGEIEKNIDQIVKMWYYIPVEKIVDIMCI